MRAPGRFVSDIPEGFELAAGPSRPVARIRSGGRRLAVRISRIGTNVIEVAAEAVGLETLLGEHVELEIDDFLQPLSGLVTAATALHATFAILEPKAAPARALLAVARAAEKRRAPRTSSEEITDPARILSIVRALFVNESPARIRAKGRDYLLRARALQPNRMFWDILEEGRVATSPLVIECSGYGASYGLEVLLTGEWRSPLPTTLPHRITRSRLRKMPRAIAPERLVARFAHPSFGFFVERPISDLSENGFGIRSVATEDLLCPGLFVGGVNVVHDGRIVASLNAVVRGVSRDGERVGFTLPSGAPSTLRDWSAFVREVLHERTRSAGYTPEALWQLYTDAGYLGLSNRKPEDFAALRTAFDGATAKLLAEPSLGYHVVWPSDRGLDAAVANVLVYSRAHLGFQMAKRPGKELGGTVGKEILRDIHWHTLEEAMSSSESDYWIGYVQLTTRFSNLLFCEFQQRFRDPQRECVVPIHPCKVDLEVTIAHAPKAAFVTIEAGDDEDVRTVCAAIQKTQLKPYWESQDFTPDRFFLEPLKARWAAAGMLRERFLKVARNARGQVEAALIVDVAEPGLHLYGLMDLARVMVLLPGGERHVMPLLDTARGIYASYGRSSFVYFHEGESAPPTRADMTSMGGASMCIISMALIPDLLDHLFEEMSWDPSLSLPHPPADRFVPSASVRDLSTVE